MDAVNDRNELSFPEKHFLGRISEELSDLIALQSAELLAEAGVVIPPKSCSLMLAIERHHPASAKDLASALDRSHQLVSQKLPKLVKLGLLECIENPEDRRQKLYHLTAKGAEQLNQFHEVQKPLESVYRQLEDEVGEVGKAISDALLALSAKSLSERIGETGHALFDSE